MQIPRQTMNSGTHAPHGNCFVGDAYVDTTSTNMYVCAADYTWTVVVPGGVPNPITIQVPAAKPYDARVGDEFLAAFLVIIIVWLLVLTLYSIWRQK